MSFVSDHLLTAIVFLPLLAALICLAFPRGDHTGVRGFTLAVTLLDLVLAFWMWWRFDPRVPGMQLTEEMAWIDALGSRYMVGIDGLSVLLVVLTAFLAPIVVLSTYSGVREHVREHMVCLLFLQAGMLGAFVATDLILFYVFWEVMLIPMYFLIGIWGGGRRVYAALKFFLYTMGGSLLMLVAIVFTAFAVKGPGELSFSWAEISLRLVNTDLGGAQLWLFLAFAVAFAIKVPMFPFHTWLPDAHVEAPTGASVILAGVLLKLGTFGFLRYAMWFFPQAAAAFLPAIGLLAVIGIIYGALVAMAQTDLKRLVAYSSVSHLGFVMLGLAAMTVTGLSGAVLQMVNHGISTGALFLLVGVIYERRHTRAIDDFGGLAKPMPLYAAVFVLIALSSIGLPGLNGFVGEFLILIGAFKSEGVALATTTGAMATAGVLAVRLIVAAVLLLVLWKLQRLRAQETLSKAAQWLLSVGAVVAAALAVTPPLGVSGRGGVLIRPLLTATVAEDSFRETFATFAVLGATGVILAAVYLLWAIQRVFFGSVRHEANQRLSDLSVRERVVLGPVCAVAVLMGVWPQPFLHAIEASASSYAQQFRERAALAPVVPAVVMRGGVVGAVALPAALPEGEPGVADGDGQPVRLAPPPEVGRERLMPWRRGFRRVDKALYERSFEQQQQMQMQMQMHGGSPPSVVADPAGRSDSQADSQADPQAGRK